MTKLNTTRRSMLGAMAVAPVALAIPGAASAKTSSAWERRLALYYCTKVADEQDYAIGDMARANEEYRRTCAELRVSDDRGWPRRLADDDPRKSAQRDAFQKVLAAEEQHYRRFSRPRWRAEKLLVLTPAPTVAALALKCEIAAEADIEKVGRLSLAEIVKRDTDRLIKGRFA